MVNATPSPVKQLRFESPIPKWAHIILRPNELMDRNKRDSRNSIRTKSTKDLPCPTFETPLTSTFPSCLSTGDWTSWHVVKPQLKLPGSLPRGNQATPPSEATHQSHGLQLWTESDNPPTCLLVIHLGHLDIPIILGENENLQLLLLNTLVYFIPLIKVDMESAPDSVIEIPTRRSIRKE